MGMIVAFNVTNFAAYGEQESGLLFHFGYGQTRLIERLNPASIAESANSIQVSGSILGS